MKVTTSVKKQSGIISKASPAVPTIAFKYTASGHTYAVGKISRLFLMKRPDKRNKIVLKK